jgi:RHS repeat-associated protein
MDARGVRTNYDYDDDPLGRLRRVSYELTGAGSPANPGPANPPAPASPVRYEYVKAGDLTKPFRVTTYDAIEEYAYDDQGRLASKTLLLADRNSFATDYGYDSLDRIRSLRYPEQYPRTPGTQGRLVELEYDLASRPRRLTVDGVAQASDIAYAPGGLPAAMFIAASGPLPIAESYEYDPANGLLTGQQVLRDDGQTLLDLTYDYARPGLPGVTGQLVRATDKLDPRGSTTYRYDAHARLREVHGGKVGAPLWTQTYTYDRFGNRTAVVAFGTAPDGSAMPTDGLPAIAVALGTNRISSPGFTYDEAGNLTRSLRPDGTWQRYQHDAAGRLVRVTDDMGATLETYIYDSGRRRIQTFDERSGMLTIYVWDGDAVIAEYDASTLRTRLSRGFVYLGPRLLCTHTAIAQLLDNPGFEETAAPPSRLSGPGGGNSAAPSWTVWNNGEATTTTEIVEATHPGAEGQMLHVRTTGEGNGIVQTFTPGVERAHAGVWVLVLEGRVGMGTGNGGNTSAHDAESTKLGEWEHLQACNGVSPANEFIVYSIASRGASFYVDNASVVADPEGIQPTRYHHPGRLGTRLITTPTTGQAIDLLTLPYGVPLPTEVPPEVAPQLTSYDRSPVTGLDYAVNRHYDPQLARFIQPDPIGPGAIHPGQPKSNNAYTYGRGDPVNTVDPLGLDTPEDWAEEIVVYGWLDPPMEDPDRNTREDRRRELGEDRRRGDNRAYERLVEHSILVNPKAPRRPTTELDWFVGIYGLIAMSLATGGLLIGGQTTLGIGTTAVVFDTTGAVASGTRTILVDTITKQIYVGGSQQVLHAQVYQAAGLGRYVGVVGAIGRFVAGRLVTSELATGTFAGTTAELLMAREILKGLAR